jgi:hypothetical protein
MKIFLFQISGGIDLRILGVYIKPLIKGGELGGGIDDAVFCQNSFGQRLLSDTTLIRLWCASYTLAYLGNAPSRSIGDTENRASLGEYL